MNTPPLSAEELLNAAIHLGSAEAKIVVADAARWSRQHQADVVSLQAVGEWTLSQHIERVLEPVITDEALLRHMSDILAADAFDGAREDPEGDLGLIAISDRALDYLHSLFVVQASEARRKKDPDGARFACDICECICEQPGAVAMMHSALCPLLGHNWRQEDGI
ncbi:hypothetical protein RGI145_12435 [Roseomonas gilardii]|uniref:Uncharacterized protein n=2 Tax=Roseomonas gilardii TaxID=257708 RepID=A0A1L7AGF7_9PROT|nr:hypothetical protein RGI145_12435 [Roseomonas gilardii]